MSFGAMDNLKYLFRHMIINLENYCARCFEENFPLQRTKLHISWIVSVGDDLDLKIRI